MYTFWSQIQNIFSCSKQPLEEIVNPIVNIEHIISVTDINEIKEPEPIISEDPIINTDSEMKIEHFEVNDVADAESDFEEFGKYEIAEQEDFDDLPDLIFIDNTEYDSYGYYASDEDNDYYRN